MSSFWSRNAGTASSPASLQSLGDAGTLHYARSQWQLSAAYDLRLECSLAHRTECLVREAQLGEGIELVRNLLTLPPLASRVELDEQKPELPRESTQRTLIRLINSEMARITRDSNIAYVDALLDLWLTFVFASQEEQSRCLSESTDMTAISCSSLREPCESPEADRTMHLSSETMELDASGSPPEAAAPPEPQHSISIASLKQLLDYVTSTLNIYTVDECHVVFYEYCYVCPCFS